MDFSDFFITKSQASDFLDRLSQIIDSIYTTHFVVEKVLMDHFGVRRKDAFIKLLREQKIPETDPNAVKGFLEMLQKTISALPVVSLTIAFEPNDESLKAFSQWFLFTLKKQVVLDILVDQSIIAGAKITVDGRFKDYSLRNLFLDIQTKVMQTNVTPTHQEIPHQTAEHMGLGR